MMNESEDKNTSSNSGNTAEVATFAAGGAVAGATTSVLVGNMGLAVAGTALSIGLLPVVAVGAVAGLAAYGIKRAFFDADTVQPTTNPPNVEKPSSTET